MEWASVTKNTGGAAPSIAPCQQKLLLLREVIEAVRRSIKARKEYDRAAEADQDIGPFIQAFGEARLAERAVITKLARHRKEHSC